MLIDDGRITVEWPSEDLNEKTTWEPYTDETPLQDSNSPSQSFTDTIDLVL